MTSTLAAIPIDMLRAGTTVLFLGYLTYRRGNPTTRSRIQWGMISFGLLFLGLEGLANLQTATTAHTALVPIGAAVMSNLIILGFIGWFLLSLRLITRANYQLLLGLGLLLPTHPTGSALPLAPDTAPHIVFAPAVLFGLLVIFAIELIFRGTAGSPPHKDISPLAAAVGKRVQPSELHTEHSGFIFYREGRPTMSGPSIARIRDYIHWRNATAGIQNISSIAELESELHLDDYAASSDDLDAESVEYYQLKDWVPWVAEQEYVWVTSGPPFEQLLFLGTIVALIVGNPLLFLPI